MKRIVAISLLVVFLLSSAAAARPIVVRGGYAHPVYVGRYYPHYHNVYGHHVSFGVGFGTYYAPAPVYVAGPPVVYYAPPPVVVAPPVMMPPPVVVQPPAVAQPESGPGQPPPPPPPPPLPQQPRFVETGRRFHEHGSDAGKLDWVEGLLDSRPIRIYYDEFGRVRKQKWID